MGDPEDIEKEHTEPQKEPETLHPEEKTAEAAPPPATESEAEDPEAA